MRFSLSLATLFLSGALAIPTPNSKGSNGLSADIETRTAEILDIIHLREIEESAKRSAALEDTSKDEPENGFKDTIEPDKTWKLVKRLSMLEDTSDDNPDDGFEDTIEPDKTWKRSFASKDTSDESFDDGFVDTVEPDKTWKRSFVSEETSEDTPEDGFVDTVEPDKTW